MTSACELSTSHDPSVNAARYPSAHRIKAVCLDLDDTLLDNETSSRLGLTALVGNDAAWPVWRRTTDEHYPRFVAGEVDFDVMCRARIRAFFAAFGEDISEGEAARRERVRMEAMQRAWRLFDDVWPCLEWLRTSGLRLAAITNAPGPYQRKKIASVGLAGSFEALLISGEVGVAKPDERIFGFACAELGLHPAEVVHVGDRLDVDAMGAVAAGMHGIWLNRSASAVSTPEDVATITNLNELPEHLVCDLAAPVDVFGGWSASNAHDWSTDRTESYLPAKTVFTGGDSRAVTAMG